MSTISGVSSSGDAWANMRAQRSQLQAKMFAKVDSDSSGGIDKTELQSLIDDVAKKTGVANSSTDELFSKMDSNGDGSLSKDELGTGMKDILPPPSTMDFAQSRTSITHGKDDGDGDDLFNKIDTDSSGSISKEELQSLVTNMAGDNSTDGTSSASSTTAATDDLFARLDANGDGSLNKTELDAGRTEGAHEAKGSHGPQGAGGPPPAGPPPTGSAGASSNASTTYDPLDTNEDGTVSIQERMAASTDATDPLQALFKTIDTDGDHKISSNESDTFIQKLSAQLEATAQSTSDASSTKSTSGTQSSTDGIDLAELVTQAYEQIASGMAQHAKGSTLSAVA